MNDVKQKYVISHKRKIIIGRCKLHKQLDKKAISGGWWFWDKENSTLVFYGESHDFGQAREEQILNDIPTINKKFRNEVKRIVYEEDASRGLVDILSEWMAIERAEELVDENDWV